MEQDVRGTPQYAAVSEHLRQLHEPAFGRPHAVSEPTVTADGTRVVVTGAVFDELAGLPRTALFAVADGRLRVLTSAPGSSRQARFSPDGRLLAFLSDRSRPGVFQLHLLESGRFGEAAAAPAVPGTVEYVRWSPDGRRILLGVAGLGADMAGGQGSGVNTITTDGLPSWHPAIQVGTPEFAWRTLWLYDVVTGELSRLSPEGLNCWEADWCGPSGVLAVASDRPGEDDWYDAVLTHIELDTGERRELLRSDVQIGLPTGSPDGRYAAVVQAVCSDRWIIAGDVLLIDVRSGGHVALDTEATDATWLQWLDAERLGYTGQRGLDSVGGVIDVPGHAVTEVFSTVLSCGGNRYPDGAFTADGRVVVVQNAYDVPPEVAMLGTDKDEVLASTAHAGTDHLCSVAGRAEIFRWTAPDGLEIEGVLCLPSGEGPFPLVVNIHGGPISAFRNMWSMRSPWVPLLVSRGYAVLNPNPRGSGGRGQAFAGLVVGDMGGADAQDIIAGIDALADRRVIDPARVGLIGGSYGGFMSSWLVTQDQRFAAAVPIAPVTDWYSMSVTSNIGGWARSFSRTDPELPGGAFHTRSPVLQASKVRTPCLNVAGARDMCTPPGQAHEFHQALRSHGHIPSVLAIYPEEGHGVRAFPALTDFLTRVVIWFESHMPAASGTPSSGPSTRPR